jgi:hypothetical protein
MSEFGVVEKRVDQPRGNPELPAAAQATRKAGPIIRIAMVRAEAVMAGSLAEETAQIKGIPACDRRIKA